MSCRFHQDEGCHADALASGRKNRAGGLSSQTVLHHHRVLHRALTRAVQLLLIARNPCDAVDGSMWPPDSFTSAYRAAMPKAKLPHLNVHALGHSHATILLKSGINPKVVSKRLGHAKVATTLDIYSQILPGMQEEAARRIDSALRSAIEARS